MTCRELQQRPVYCRVTDSPERALDLMKLLELPALPVVLSHHERQLQGLVLASTIQAAIDAAQVPALVADLMSPPGLVVQAHDDYHRVAGEMTQRGLTFVPIVDAAYQLIGLLMPGAAVSLPAPARKFPVKALVLAASVIGVAVIYYRTRWGHLLAKRIVSSMPDQQLQARVRAALAHLTSHPHDVSVSVNNGSVALSGDLSAEELARLEAGVGTLSGVHAVAVAGPRL